MHTGLELHSAQLNFLITCAYFFPAYLYSFPTLSMYFPTEDQQSVLYVTMKV